MSSKNQITDPEELKYLTVGEIREEIALAVDGDAERYCRGGYNNLNQADLRRVAEALQPEGDDTDLGSSTCLALFKNITEWAELEYSEEERGLRKRNPNLTRDILKQIHRALSEQYQEAEHSP